MRLLIVEDDELKRTRIAEVLEGEFPEAKIVLASSVHSAVRTIASELIDVVVLDMTLPTFDSSADEDGGTRKPYGGREVLRQMEARDLPVPVVVVTQFDRFGEGDRALGLQQLDEQLQIEYGNYLGAVQYRSEFEGWKEALFDKVRTGIERRMK